MGKQLRGVSSIISTILLVAIVVVLSAVISVFVVDLGEDLRSVSPNVAESSGEFTAGADDADQVVRITHISGDPVNVGAIAIVLRATDQNEQVRLVNLPGDGYFSYTLADSNIQGDTAVIDQGPFASNVNEGPIYTDANDQQWEAGETVAIELAVGGWDFRTSDYNELAVLIVHTESDSILIAKHLSA